MSDFLGTMIGAVAGGSQVPSASPADHPMTAGIAGHLAAAAEDIAANPSVENIVEESAKAALNIGALEASRFSSPLAAVLQDFGPLLIPAIVSALGHLFKASGTEKPANFAALETALNEAAKKSATG